MAFRKTIIPLTLLLRQVYGLGVARSGITAAPILAIDKRQDIAVTCGYINAYILSPLGCEAGLGCVDDATLNVAGCCRLGDSANCNLPTACVQQADLTRSCDGSCSSNQRIAKCTDSASPYCYTRYWVSGAKTPLEIGCTTTQGLLEYVYTTYTGFGASIEVVSTQTGTMPAATGQQSASAGAVANSGNDNTGIISTASDSQAGSSSDSDAGSSSPPAGAIAGGVVGGLAVIGIVVAIIVWIVLRHRRRSRLQPPSAASNVQPGGSRSVIGTEKTVGTISTRDESSQPPVSPLSGTIAGPERLEMSAQGRTHEMYSQQQRPVRKELPGRETLELP